MTNENDRKTGCLIGLATVGCALTGIISLFAALSRLYWGDWSAAALFLLAAALSFGILANAILRH